jgi:ferritin
MLKPKVLPAEIVDLLLPRLQDEHNAYYMYRSASNWCQNVGFFKAAKFFAAESADELLHAKKIEDYLTEWNVIPELPTVKQPILEFASLMDVIEKAYLIEYTLYEDYEDTSAKIMKLGDVCTFNFLLEFNSIQQKSVAEYSDKINMLDGVTGSKFEMLLLEKSLFKA